MTGWLAQAQPVDLTHGSTLGTFVGVWILIGILLAFGHLDDR